MSLHNYVVDVETAKKLEEKGFGKESEFYWYSNTGNSYELLNSSELNRAKLTADPNFIDRLIIIKTYILAQVLEELPSEIIIKECRKQEDQFGACKCSIFGKTFNLKISKEDDSYTAFYECAKNYVIIKEVEDISQASDENPANAAAKLWLWCEGMGYIK